MRSSRASSRTPYHGLCPQRPRPPIPGRTAQAVPARLSDLILAVLGVVVLGGLALAAHALAAHALAAASLAR